MNTLAILNIVSDVVFLIMFIRFFVQLSGVSPHEPSVAPIYKTTAIVDLFATVIPNFMQGRFSSATLLVIFLFTAFFNWGMMQVSGQMINPVQLFVASVFVFLFKVVNACYWLLIAMVIVSWIMMLSQKDHPFFQLVMYMAEPIIAPFRKITPNMGMIDLSPMIAILVLILLEGVLGTLAQSMM